MIQFADIDGDGVIDYLEFVSLMMNLNFEERNETARIRVSHPSTPGSETSVGSLRANGARTNPGNKKDKKQQVLQRR